MAQSWDGASWSDPAVYFPDPANGPVTAPVLPAVSCTSGPSCVIADGSGHVSTGDGTTWSVPSPMPPAPSWPSNPADPGAGHPGSRSAALSCPSPAFCAAVDNTGQAFAFEGGTWRPPQSFGVLGAAAPSPALYQQGRVGISCPTSSSCTAVVGNSVLDWNGSSWTQQPAPWTTSLAGLRAYGHRLSHHVAVLHRERDRGLGRPPGRPVVGPGAVDGNGQLDSISCPSATFCLASDASGSVVTWNGATWSGPNRVIPAAAEYPGIGTTVSCPSPEFCMVLNSDGDYATYSGSATP